MNIKQQTSAALLSLKTYRYCLESDTILIAATSGSLKPSLNEDVKSLRTTWSKNELCIKRLYWPCLMMLDSMFHLDAWITVLAMFDDVRRYVSSGCVDFSIGHV